MWPGGDVANSSQGVYESLSEAAAALGIACRGGFVLRPDEKLPDEDETGPDRTLVLLGFTGAMQWAAFTASAEFADRYPHPLDRWSARVIGQLAEAFRARPLYPFGGPPWWPFQRWAQRAEMLHASPLGILMHPRFGLWHAYRGALLFAEELALPLLTSWSSPCDSCETKPCITNCPAGAVTPGGFDRPTCAAHVASPPGVACRSGCLARGGCPIAVAHRYGTQQATFHMSQLESQ
jgi:hypothetical protein